MYCVAGFNWQLPSGEKTGFGPGFGTQRASAREKGAGNSTIFGGILVPACVPDATRTHCGTHLGLACPKLYFISNNSRRGSCQLKCAFRQRVLHGLLHSHRLCAWCRSGQQVTGCFADGCRNVHPANLDWYWSIF